MPPSGGGNSYEGPYTITPGTSNLIIPENSLLTEDLTILGDSDLTASNIKSGVDIFGIVGTLITSDFKVTTGQVTFNYSDITIYHNLGAVPKIFVMYCNSYYTSSKCCVYLYCGYKYHDGAFFITYDTYSQWHLTSVVLSISSTSVTCPYTHFQQNDTYTWYALA